MQVSRIRPSCANLSDTDCNTLYVTAQSGTIDTRIEIHMNTELI